MEREQEEAQMSSLDQVGSSAILTYCNEPMHTCQSKTTRNGGC